MFQGITTVKIALYQYFKDLAKWVPNNVLVFYKVHITENAVGVPKHSCIYKTYLKDITYPKSVA